MSEEEAEEYYNKLWLENKELIQENIERLDKKRFAQSLMLAEKDKEIERLHSIIKEVREYIELCLTEAYNEEETKIPIEYMEQVQIYLEGDKE